MRSPSSNRITLLFGSIAYPYSKTSPHIGVDFSPIPDPNIYAPEDGRVVLIYGDPQMGNCVHLYAGNRHHALCHMSQIIVPNGSQVKQGDKIGVMGYSGYVVPAGPVGTHLHWALAVDDKLIDPLSMITAGGKGADEMVADKAYIDWVWDACLGRARDRRPNEGDEFIGKDAGNVFKEIYFSDEAATHRRATYDALANISGEFVEVTKLYVKK